MTYNDVIQEIQITLLQKSDKIYQSCMQTIFQAGLTQGHDCSGLLISQPLHWVCIVLRPSNSFTQNQIFSPANDGIPLRNLHIVCHEHSNNHCTSQIQIPH